MLKQIAMKAVSAVTALALCSCVAFPVEALAGPGSDGGSGVEEDAEVLGAGLEPSAEEVRQLVDGRQFVPGEVVVVAEAGADLRGGTAERLAEAGADALELTAQAAEESDEPGASASARRAELSDAGSYEISVVRSDAKSTEELIEELYADPRVISATPNYVAQPSAAESDLTAGVGSALTAAEAASSDTRLEAQNKTPSYHEQDMPDLDSLQWTLQNDGIYNTPEGNAVAGVDMGVPGFAAYRAGGSTSEAAAAAQNSSPQSAIAVADSGIDEKHPDLQGVFYEFSAEQQARYRCGLHGLNATLSYEEREDPKAAGDISDHLDHGTHVAGSVAAAWDGRGTSGIANGAKLIGVRLSDDSGAQTTESSVRGFNFLIDCASDVNLKAVNCSWSSEGVEFTYTLLVNELGKRGVITVFASGNEFADADEAIDSSSMVDSPYVLLVDAMNPAGGKVGFSNYGATVTDVFAPGSLIVSTVPDYVLEKGGGARVYRRFLPQSARDVGVVSWNRFEGGKDWGVQAYASDPTKGATALIGEVSDEMGLDDAFSFKLDAGNLSKPSSADGNPVGYVPDCAYVAIPVGEDAMRADGTADVSYVSMYAALKNGELASLPTDIFGFLATTRDGSVKTVDFSRYATDFRNSAQGSAESFSWANLTMDVAQMLESDAEVQSVYLDEKGRMVVLVGVADPSHFNVSDIYLDNLAVGSSKAKAGAYTYFCGTSMAAPAVTGALGVIAKDEPKVEGEAALSQQALERVARLRAATVRTDALDGYCATGGYVNLAPYGDGTYAKSTDGRKAPIIESASANGATLAVEGHFFGNSTGRALIDGQLASVASWADGAVRVSVPAGLGSGAHVVSVETDAGVDKAPFSYTSSSDTAPALFEIDLAIPDLGLGAQDWDYFDVSGIGPLKGGMAVSGGSLYAMQVARDGTAQRLWRYDIGADAWSVCADLPEKLCYGHPEPSAIAPTSQGVMVYMEYTREDESGLPEFCTCLYEYDAANDSWSQRHDGTDLPSNSGIFTRGDDVYFVGGILGGMGNTPLLSVLRKGSDALEVLGAEELDWHPYIESASVAATDGCVYACGSEPYQATFDYPRGLVRMKLGADDLVEDIENLAPELARVGVTQPGSYGNYPRVATTSNRVLVTDAATAGAGVYSMGDRDAALAPIGKTATYHRGNQQMTAWSDDRLYVIGYSPSEPNKMYFRSTVEHDWELAGTTPATASAHGEAAYTCKVCGATKTETLHNWDAGTTMSSATCTAEGEVLHACTLCDATEVEPIAAFEHEWGTWAKVDDDTHERTCQHDTTHLQKGGHWWDDGVVTKKATYTTEGVLTYTCTECGATTIEAIPKLKRTSLKKATISKLSNMSYAGKALTPEPTVKLGGKTLTKDADYKLRYANNVNAGTATVTIIGKGAYKGTRTVTFKIVQAKNSAKAKKTKVKKTFEASKLKKAVTVALPKVTATFGSAKWKVTKKDKKKALTLNAKAGKVKVGKGTKAGAYTIKLKAKVAKTANYKAASTKTVTVKVTVR